MYDTSDLAHIVVPAVIFGMAFIIFIAMPIKSKLQLSERGIHPVYAFVISFLVMMACLSILYSKLQ